LDIFRHRTRDLQERGADGGLLLYPELIRRGVQ
jgi:hypothetical protein